MNKKIILDVDGVLLNFIEAFEQVAISMEDELGVEITVKPNVYDLSKRLGITPEQEKLIWEKFSKAGTWQNLNPLPGVEDSIKKIKEAGFDIYIVTAIEEAFKEQRLVNLAKIGVSPLEIHCVGYGADKIKYVQDIKPDVFIDDRLEHLHNANVTYHLVWLRDSVEQHKLKEDAGVDVVVDSLKEWVDNHMPAVISELDAAAGQPIQRKLRFV